MGGKYRTQLNWKVGISTQVVEIFEFKINLEFLSPPSTFVLTKLTQMFQIFLNMSLIIIEFFFEIALNCVEIFLFVSYSFTVIFLKCFIRLLNFISTSFN